LLNLLKINIFFMTSVICLAVSGCAALFPEAPPSTYDLAAVGDISGAGARRGIFVVAEPIAIQAIDSQRIVARTAGGQVTYVPHAQWADKLTALLQTRIVQSFENSGRLVSVGRPGERLAAQAVLATDIRAFELVDRGSSSFARVEISAKIVGDRSGQITAAQVFSAQVPVSVVDGAEASRGLNSALAEVLGQMIKWANSRV
jgi:cholesterol transport system auxiliary component